MKFSPTAVAGVTLVEHTAHRDARGKFTRMWCRNEFEAAGIASPIVQVSLSKTERRGTLRGLHFQSAPSREGKLVQCTAGKIYDIALDLRPKSRSFLRHFGTELSPVDARALFIPPGCAHGFLTLTDDCSVLYMMTAFYDPALSSGVRWDDPAFGIQWPFRPLEIIDRDATYPDFSAATVAGFDGY